MLVHPVERGAASACQQASYRLVGEQHELLDQRMRARLLVPVRIHHSAVCDVERQLARREVEGAARVTAGAQIACERIGARQQVAVRVTQAPREHVVGLVVGQPRAAADQRTAHVRRADLAVGADAHLDADHAPDLARAQAAGVGRELERQHRLHRAGHVHAAGAARRLGIQLAARRHVARDVRDVHERTYTVAIRLDADRVVEVARGRRVDRDGLELEQVRPLPLGLALARRPSRLAQRALRPLACEAALQQQRAQHVLDVVGRAQPLDDARARAARLDNHQLARLDRQPRAPAEGELLSLVEERQRDEKAPSALDGAGDETRPVRVAHAGM